MIPVVHVGGKMFQFLKDAAVLSRACSGGPCQLVSWAHLVRTPIWLPGSPSGVKLPGWPSVASGAQVLTLWISEVLTATCCVHSGECSSLILTLKNEICEGCWMVLLSISVSRPCNAISTQLIAPCPCKLWGEIKTLPPKKKKTQKTKNSILPKLAWKPFSWTLSHQVTYTPQLTFDALSVGLLLSHNYWKHPL